MRYAVVIEWAGGDYSTHRPDLLVFIESGATVVSIRFHADG